MKEKLAKGVRIIGALSRFVTDQGELDPVLVTRREPLYQGMNGRYVERFYTSADKSYIFKPVTHQGQEEREIWIYEHVLPKVPNVYPPLLEHSKNGDHGWAIYEDLGALSHEHKPSTLLRMAKLAARLHSMDVSSWDPSVFRAPKPPVIEMAEQLMLREGDAERLLQEAGIPSTLFQQALSHTKESGLAEARVLNHGDLHAGNYASASGRLYVLDWEHVHLNSPLWDLYHLLDMSHPVFPRSFPVTAELKERILRIYGDQRRYFERPVDESLLLADYWAFAFIFSLWMLQLVDGDLQKGSVYWSREQLLRQRSEVTDSLKDCGMQLLQSVPRRSQNGNIL